MHTDQLPTDDAQSPGELSLEPPGMAEPWGDPALDPEDPPGMQEISRQTLLEEEQTTVIEQPERLPIAAEVPTPAPTAIALEQRMAELRQQERQLQQDMERSRATLADLQAEADQLRSSMGQLIQDALKELDRRRQELQITVDQLERRQERIRQEMRTTFAGVSQDLAIRVQSFKDYLVGSLQDLALAAEQLEFPQPQVLEKVVPPAEPARSPATTPRFAEQSFQDQTKQIRSLLDQYRNRPDYYGPPWQLRRTFEPIHAERVSNWFFTQGGRGAIRTMGSRLQNILVASAVMSILFSLDDDRLRVLVLADSPERLGEWRRGLQDCLGITRSDFGPDRGVALFEDAAPLSQRADRLIKDGQHPLILIDETEDQINLSVLQYPLWLAFAPNPQSPSSSASASIW